ncbi:MAG: sigma-54-dependent Fis family transcriptional regulator [Myxococcales bacterium]|nr:sigma-54-dependent Fis family transcriptional regulator [Myxococcales bacterium]
MSQILVVDDDRSMREMLEIFFAREGFSVRTAESLPAALDLLADQPADLVITDLKMKGGSGLDLLREVRTRHPATEVILITAYATTETAVSALQLGAYDYVTKPFQMNEMKVVVQRALERRRLLSENLRMRAELAGGYDFGRLIGKSPRMQEVYRLIDLVAPTRSNVLVTGESGTGKELVARAIHLRSPRHDGPFVPIDCASIPPALMESELFGARRGAYTGAYTDRQGLFELADGGTAFLDEVGDIPLDLQVKLLRVIQERTVRRLGDSRDRPVDVRVVAATHRDVEGLVSSGKLREDLFFRLNVVRIHLPPLRERREDIPALARHFVEQIAHAENRPPPALLPEAVQRLCTQPLPGNVRELHNLIERAMALSGGGALGPDLFDPAQGTPDPCVPTEVPENGLALDEVLGSIERRLLEAALRRAGGVRKEAAKLLRISFRSMLYRLKKHRME